ncbi:MAG: hypothetical protein R3F33_07425 [Planctomycetota bacterium]
MEPSAATPSTWNILRWILVIPVGFVAWFVVLFAGLFALAILGWFCPEEELVSGTCTAHWYLAAEDAWIAACAGISAIAVVALPILVAPSHRAWVATAAFLVGAACVVWFWVDGGLEEWPPAVAALLAGVVTLAWILRRLRVPFRGN